MQKRYKITLFKGDLIFAAFIEKTRKEAETQEKLYRQEIKNYEERPTQSVRGWVYV